MDIEELYRLWVKETCKDKCLSDELKKIYNSDKEKYERFYKNLEFGTAGLRGIMGAGTNRMNIYTVKRATRGLGKYLMDKYKEGSVAISYDSRNKSELFAIESAKVLASSGFKVYISHEIQPTPVLSFCVRELSCQAGIMITASHNPAEYNGYKCYNEDGCQIADSEANEIYNYIDKINIFESENEDSFENLLNKGKILFINQSVYDKYLDCVLGQQINKHVLKECDLKVTYTPLNGAGNKLVRKTLGLMGVNNLNVVKEQEFPDGNFPTCNYPNPETHEALELAIKLAEKSKSDVIIATDPDSDRIGVGVKNNTGYKILSGNEIGVLLLHYILDSKRKNNILPKNGVMVKTIVSTPMADVIARAYDCDTVDVLTGFKYIGKEILKLENNNQADKYLFGFEESHGYLIGTYVRDKDGIAASMMVCEMAAYYKKSGKTLINLLNELYDKYGFYYNKNLSFQFDGSSGIIRMNSIMNKLRESNLNLIGKLNIQEKEDYLKSEILNISSDEVRLINLPKSNVLRYKLQGGNNIIVRPSGTEPKIKVYIQTNGKSIEESKEIYSRIENDIKELF